MTLPGLATDESHSCLTEAQHVVYLEGLKTIARREFQRALADGTIKKPDQCVRCLGQFSSRKIQAHHVDYTQPLVVEWVCPQCHALAHRGDITNRGKARGVKRHAHNV